MEQRYTTRRNLNSKYRHIKCVLPCAVLLALAACSTVEYTPREKYYTIDKAERTTNAYRLNDLSKGKKVRGDWGTVHVSTSSDPKEEDIKIELRKEKDIGPSRYKAQTRLPKFMPGDINSDFHFSFDKKRDFWVGLEFKIENDKWLPKFMK